MAKATLSSKILALLSQRDGQSDHQLAVAIDGNDTRMPAIGNECRYLVKSGQLCKQMRPDGIMGNFLRGKFTVSIPNLPATRPEMPPPRN